MGTLQTSSPWMTASAHTVNADARPSFIHNRRSENISINLPTFPSPPSRKHIGSCPTHHVSSHGWTDSNEPVEQLNGHSPSVLSPSPSLRLVDLKRWPRPRFFSQHNQETLHASSGSSAQTDTSIQALHQASTTGKRHTCGRSWALPTTNHSVATEEFQERSPAALEVDETPQARLARGDSSVYHPLNRPTVLHRYTNTATPSANHSSKRLSISRSYPNFPSMAAPYGEGRAVLVRREVSHVHQPKRILSGPQVTTELDFGAHFLEPNNSCEAILLPRPRLRARSLSATPSVPLEKTHSVPERFWQTDAGINSHPGPTLLTTTKVVRSQEEGGGEFQAPRKTLSSSVKKDHRLTLHEKILPPLPPVDVPLPSSGLLPIKSLPVTPLPPSTPEAEATRTSSDSLEQMDAPELLHRNEELDKDRHAWRREHRSSLGANVSSMQTGLSPWLGPFSASASSLTAQRSEATMRFREAAPIKVHRVRHEDLAGQTLLVVQAQDDRPHSTLVSSVSSPDLSGRQEGRPSVARRLTTRLRAFAGGKPERRPTSLQIQPDTKSHADPERSSQLNSNVVRLTRAGRKLVTDETVVICRQPGSSVNTAEHPGNLDREEVHLGEALPGTASPRTYPALPSRYRPAGTRDEIKAQLGENLLWQQGRSLRLDGHQYRQIDNDGLTRSEPGSDSFTPPEPVLRERTHVRSESHVEEMESAQMQQPPAWSISSSSRSVSIGSRESGRYFESAQRSSHDITGRGLAIESQRSDAELLAAADTRDSSVSTQPIALWDANSVDFDNLFFRPPRR